jgi:hypothetical protein
MIDRLTQWNRTVALFVKVHTRWDGELPDTWFVGRIRRTTRLLRAGDLVLGSYWNGGGERQPVECYSSRGYSVEHLYLPYSRGMSRPKEHYGERFFEFMDKPRPKWLGYETSDHTDRALMEILDLPDELATLSPADPAVRRYAAEILCAGDAARPVGAGSRALC